MWISCNIYFYFLRLLHACFVIDNIDLHAIDHVHGHVHSHCWFAVSQRSDVAIELHYFTDNSMEFDCHGTGNINPITFSSGRFKWLSDFNLLQRFVTEILNLKGTWTVPRSGCRQLKTEYITIRLYDNQSIVLEGAKVNGYKEFLRKIAEIKPNSASNWDEDEFEPTPAQKARYRILISTC